MSTTKVFSYEDVQSMLGNCDEVYTHPTTGLTQFLKYTSKKVQLIVHAKQNIT